MNEMLFEEFLYALCARVITYYSKSLGCLWEGDEVLSDAVIVGVFFHCKQRPGTSIYTLEAQSLLMTT